jgi:hypothetical protein
VEAVAIVNQLPMTDVSANASFDVEGRPSNTDINVADTQIISPDYFRAMGITLMRGRFLNDDEAKLAPASVIVNQTLARKVWPEQIPSASESGLAQTTPGFQLLVSWPISGTMARMSPPSPKCISCLPTSRSKSGSIFAQ